MTIRVGAAGVGLLFIFVGSALATWPTAALPPDLPEADGKSLMTPAMASFVRIDNAAFEALARLFHAVVAPRAMKVTTRIVGDIAKTARAIDDAPGRVDAALRERPDVPPRELAEFRR